MIQISMEMPTKCSECRMRTDYDYCSAMPKNFCGNTEDNGKPEWCPLKEVPVNGGWISVKDRLPENGKHVLVCCEVRPSKKKYVCDGFYASNHSISAHYVDDDIAYEYDEEADEYFLLEGWYEVIKNWEEYTGVVIDDFVTYWMPLPEPPKEE